MNKLNNISFKQALFGVFLFGNILLGFVSRIFIGAIREYDLSVWFRHLNLVIVIFYTIWSLVFLYKKSMQQKYSKKVVRGLLCLYILVSFLFFCLSGFLSPLSFTGYYLFRGLINGDWALDYFDSWVALIQQNSGE